jgi:GAF domain-containing protein
MSAALRPLVGFDCFAVFSKCDDSAVVLYRDGPCADAFSDAPLPVGRGLSGWVVESGRPIVNGNPTVETSLRPGDGPFTADSSALSIPLFDAGGAVFGALTLYSRNRAAFSSEQMQMLQAIEPGFSRALGNAISGVVTTAQAAGAPGPAFAELSAS